MPQTHVGLAGDSQFQLRGCVGAPVCACACVKRRTSVSVSLPVEWSAPPPPAQPSVGWGSHFSLTYYSGMGPLGSDSTLLRLV